MKKLLVIAADYQVAVFLAAEAGYHRDDIQYVHHPEGLLGTRSGRVLYALGEWTRNGRADDIMEKALARGLKVEFTLPRLHEAVE